MGVITVCQATFSNVQEITVSDTAPKNPYKGQSWTDTSKTPPVIKVWDGSKWVDKISNIEQTVTQHTEKLSSHDAKISANETAILLRVTKQDYEANKTLVDGKLSSMTSKLSAAETKISALQDQILLKVEQTDIEEYVGTALGDYSTTSQMTAAIELSKTGILSTVSNTYAKQEELKKVQTQASQTAEKFSWLVKSGTSATNFTLTDRAVKLVTDTIDLSAANLVNIISGSSAKIKAKNISLEGLITANSKFKILTDGSMAAVGGTFNGNVKATDITALGSYRIYNDQTDMKVISATATKWLADNHEVSVGIIKDNIATPQGTYITFADQKITDIEVSTISFHALSTIFNCAVFVDQEMRVSGKIRMDDSIVFANAKGIRAYHTNGTEYPILYLGEDNGISVGNATLVTTIKGSTVRTEGTVYLGTNIVTNNNNAYYCKSKSGTNRETMKIDTSDTFLIGSPSHVTAIRGTSVRLSSASGTVVTSDRRKKKEIMEMDQRHEEFFMNLCAVHFKMREQEDDKIRYGFIAQDVETALQRAGLSREDFAGLDIVMENGQEIYGLIYEQFIPLAVYMIQRIQKENKNQKHQIESLQYQLVQAFDYISKLEKKVEKEKKYVKK